MLRFSRNNSGKKDLVGLRFAALKSKKFLGERDNFEDRLSVLCDQSRAEVTGYLDVWKSLGVAQLYFFQSVKSTEQTLIDAIVFVHVRIVILES